MSEASPSVPDVFTVREIARAAAVDPHAVQDLVDTAEVRTIDGHYIALTEAVGAVMLLRRASAGRNPGLFRTGTHFKRSPGGALAASAGLHLAMLAAVLFLSTLTVATGSNPDRSIAASRLPRHSRSGRRRRRRRAAPANSSRAR